MLSFGLLDRGGWFRRLTACRPHQGYCLGNSVPVRGWKIRKLSRAGDPPAPWSRRGVKRVLNRAAGYGLGANQQRNGVPFRPQILAPTPPSTRARPSSSQSQKTEEFTALPHVLRGRLAKDPGQ